MYGLGIIIGKIPKNGNVEPVYNLIFPLAFVTNDTSSGILYKWYLIKIIYKCIAYWI